MKKAIFLDRDGVINRAFVSKGRPIPPKNIENLEILPGVDDAINILKSHNYEIIVVTNQPDVVRKINSLENVNGINKYLKSQLKIDFIKVCYHDDFENCDCRKPKPGMLIKTAQENNIDLRKSFMIGDRWRDINAGKAAGTKTIFLDYSYSEKLREKPDFVTDSLFNSLSFILGDNYEKHQ